LNTLEAGAVLLYRNGPIERKNRKSHEKRGLVALGEIKGEAWKPYRGGKGDSSDPGMRKRLKKAQWGGKHGNPPAFKKGNSRRGI